MNFEALYEACFHRLYRFALALTHGHQAEAEDIVQETFFRALQHADELPEGANVIAWLYRVARNVYISRLRKHQRNAGDALLDAVPSGEDIEHQLVNHDQSLRILTALHSLNEPYKEIFTLRTLGDLSYREIASIFGKGESWARVMYYRARMMLIEKTQKEESL